MALWCKVPVWNEDTPENFRKVPVGRINEKYVEGYYNEKFCIGCDKVVYVPEKEGCCPECGGNRFLWEEDHCPECKIGRIVENEDFRIVI